MEIFGYLAAVAMGLSLGMIGGGGSILTVPILVYLFHINPLTATAYSLFIVGTTALVGGLSYLKRKEVDLKTGVIFALPSFVGVYLTRAFLIPRIPDPVFTAGGHSVSKSLLVMMVFAVIMLAAAGSMIKKRESGSAASQLSGVGKYGLISVEGLVVGAVTGFVGAGGGFLIIPALVVLAGLPMKLAVGTSLLIIAAKSLGGFVGDLQQGGEIHWPLLGAIVLVALFGLFLGMRLSRRVPEQALKKAFGYFVLLMGAFILVDQIWRAM